MSQEIKSQIDAMGKMKATCTFCNGIGRGVMQKNNDSSEEISEETQGHFQDCLQWATVLNENQSAATRSVLESNTGFASQHPPYPELAKMKDLLLQTKTELEKKARELEHNGQENSEKLRIQQQHCRDTREALIQQHQSEIHKLSKEITRVKKDAKVVINFVRRKANEALDKEEQKRSRERNRMNRMYEEREVELKDKFIRSLGKVERQIAHVLRNEKVAMNDGYNDALPSPPRPRRPYVRRRDSLRDTMGSQETSQRGSIESDASIQGDVMTDDSISTQESQDFNFSENREWFKDRINELEKWTDTLTAALQNRACVESARSLPMRPRTPSPPLIRKTSSHQKWEL